MTGFFTYRYSRLVHEDNWREKYRINSLRRWLLRLSANAVLPIWYRLVDSPRTLPALSPHSPVLVSISSFAARANWLWITLESLLRQTVRPDRIVVWLPQSQFPTMEHVPASLRRMQARGVEIQLVEHDYCSHKKYYYPLLNSPESLLITADDDIIYDPHMVEKLLEAHAAHPDDVIACYTHGIRRDQRGQLLPYNQWQNNVHEGDLFFGSGGGTLFPPGSLDPRVTDIHLAMQLCPRADDIWLNAMMRLHGTTLRHADIHVQVLPVLNRRTETLASTNMIYGNDQQISAVQTYFNNPF